MNEPQSHLLILGNPVGLAWVLTNQKMAFSERRVKQAQHLVVGDRVFVYASSRAFRNPKVKRGSVIADAVIRTAISQVKPINIRGLSYPYVVEMALQRLAPPGTGVELSQHIDRLDLFPDRRTWTSRIRRTIAPLSESDASFLAGKLGAVAKRDRHEALRGYEALASMDLNRVDAARSTDPVISETPRVERVLLEFLA